MTVVAGWKWNGMPLLLGDVLVSSTGDIATKQGKIPTRTAVEEVLPPEFCIQVTGTSQKIYRVSPYLAVGFAGLSATAQVLLLLVKASMGRQRPTQKEFSDFLCSIASFTDRQTSMCGWLWDEGQYLGFVWNGSDPAHVRFSDSFVIGTGSEHLNDLLTSMNGGYGSSAIEVGLSVVCTLLGFEIIHGKNIEHRFGSGYQIIYGSDDGLKMVESYTALFLVLQEQVNGQTTRSMLTRILKAGYEGELLVIQVIVLNDIGKAQIEKYYVNPLDMSYKDATKLIEGNRINMCSQFLCLYVDAFSLDNRRLKMVFIDSENTIGRYLKIITDNDTKLQITFNGSVVEEVRRIFRQIPRNQLREFERIWIDEKVDREIPIIADLMVYEESSYKDQNSGD